MVPGASAAQDDGKNRQQQRQGQTQILFGDDNQRDNGRDSSSGKATTATETTTQRPRTEGTAICR
jgi:hypothetical protein